MAKGTHFFYDQKRPPKAKRFRKAHEESLRAERLRKSHYSLSSRASVSSASSFRPRSALKAASKVLNEDRPASPTKGINSLLPSVEAGKRRVLLDSASDLKWTPQKEKLLHAIEEEDKQDRKINIFGSFDEAKFAATGILSHLVKLISEGVFRQDPDLSIDLKADLQQSFDQLTADVVVEKREWQTDCYIDWERENRNPFFESRPEEEALCNVVEFSVDRLVAKQKKRVTMAEGKTPERGKSPWPPRSTSSRPASSLSIHSETLGSEFMGGEFVDEKDEGFDYLPPGLGVPAPTTPSLLKPPVESMTPLYNLKSKTRLDKRNRMEAEAAARKIQISRKKKAPQEEKVVIDEEEGNEEDQASLVASQLMKDPSGIKFAMSNTDFEECGWIVQPDDKHDPEGVTMLKWIQARLKELVKQKTEAQFAAKLRGEDGPLVQRYYTDPQRSSFQQRARLAPSYLTIPLPPGVKPGATAMRLSLPSEEKELLADHRKKFLLLLPDGTGTVYYPNSRPAVVLTRKGDGSKGMNVFVFSNSMPQHLLAYFKPDGVFCCYHANGKLQLFSNSKGGTLYSKEGETVRQWVWPNPQYKLPQTVVVALNENVSFRSNSLSNATLYFNCGTQAHKISVCSTLETLGQVDSTEEEYTLKTRAPFSSTTAHGMLPMDALQGLHKKSGKRKQVTKSEELESSSLIGGSDGHGGDLSILKTKVKCIVDEWMEFYRKKLGIRSRTPSPLSLSRSTPFTSGTTSRLPSSKALPSRPHSHTRHQTHPQPVVSRPDTHLSTVSHHAPRFTPSPEPVPGSSVGLVYERPTTRAKSQTVSHPITITASVHEFGVKKKRLGCPVALRTKLLHRLSAVPPCKCDKRKIPRITDVEFDKYMQTHVPRSQLVVVIIVDSSGNTASGTVSGRNVLLDTLEKTHTRMNRNKSSPCEMSSQDPYRFVVYDVSTAAENTSNHSPMLVGRHVVTAGIALMYIGGKLVFAGDRFNGYGTSVKDLNREAENVRIRLDRGQHLPNDFKLRVMPTARAEDQDYPWPSSGDLERTLSDLTDDFNLSSSRLSMSLSSSKFLVSSLGRRSSLNPVEVAFLKPES